MAMFGAQARPKFPFGLPQTYDPIIQENPQASPAAKPGLGNVLAGLLQQSTAPQPYPQSFSPTPQTRGGILANALGVSAQDNGGVAPGTQTPATLPTPNIFVGGGRPAPSAAPTQLQPTAAPKPHKHTTWETIGDIAGVLLGAGPVFTMRDARRKQEQAALAREDARRQQDRAWQVEDRDFQANRPQYFMSGRDRVVFDPSTGQSQVAYDGPEDYQTYAETMGLNAGDDGYNEAVQDYVLRGNGPTSQSARRALEGVRQQNRMLLRATPTYAQTHPAAKAPRRSGGGSGAPRTMSAVVAPILAKVARGERLTPAEMQAYSMYRPGRSGNGGGGTAPGKRASGPTATDPKTGRKVQWNGSAWVPAS